jgi:hypothetical protein
MNAVEIHANLRRIEALAQEIETLSIFGAPQGSMRKAQEKSREIRRLCQSIGNQVGTGDSDDQGNTGYQGNTGHQSNTGHQGGYPNTGKDVRNLK